MWRYEGREGGATKVPVNARTGGRAMSNNKSTWATYEEAHAAYLADPTLAGLGFFLGDGFVGVDVDDCNDHLDGLSELGREVLNTVAGYAEYSPSGEGLKIITLGSLPSSRTDQKLGLEVYDRTRFFAVTGHAINREPNDLPSVPIDLSGFYAKHFGAYTATPSVDDDDLSALIHAKGPAPRWDIDRVREQLLPHLDPDGYSDWTDFGMALHHQGEGDDAWLELWDEWSQGSEKYRDGECEDKWSGFGKPSNRAELTLRTFIKRVREIQAAERFGRADYWKERIGAAKERAELTEKLPNEIARDMLVDDLVREELVQALKRRLKDQLQTNFNLTRVREMLKPKAGDDARVGVPAWVTHYVYVADEDKFFNLDNKIRYSRASFNATHNRAMPKGDSGNPIKQAADGATDDYGIRVVDSAIYNPAEELFFELDGKRCVNAYDASQIPEIPLVLTSAEERAVATVERHIQNILPNERERGLFTSWLAWVAQNPGRKVRWSPYLCGVQGDGKSFFTFLLKAAMGTSHVKSMNGDMLAGNGGFSDWAVNRCVTVIEEAKLNGANKFDAANRIKPFITNPFIDVHPKGRASYNAPNTVNYMVLSNFLDGVPADEDDRRFLFLQTPYTADSLRAFKAMNPDYDDRLFGAVENHPAAMRHWLMTFAEFHEDFKPNGNAPITQMRALVIEMSTGGPESACAAVYESRPAGVTESWVALKLFSMAVERELGERSGYSASQIGRMCANFLSKKGYRFMGAERHRVGPDRIISTFWLHQSCVLASEDAQNWWSSAEAVMQASFAKAAARDFLD